jgi:uncharacterized protein
MLLVVPHLTCNLSCRYCYERAYRHKNNPKISYDLRAILKKMEQIRPEYPEMCLHGGEPLLMGKKDVRKVLAKMKKLTGSSSIQTNGTLIDNEFIKIFKDCSTAVGISYDGPGELSDYRLHNFKNNKIEENIKKMFNAGIRLSLIMVLSKSNAGTDLRLKKLKKFLLKMEDMKISGRLNPCGGAREFELSEERLKKVYLDLAQFCLDNNLKWSPFTDVVNALQKKSRVCSLSGCDPFCTPSAAEMLEDATLTNCMRTNQEYILLRYPKRDDVRKEILFETPQEFGGCKQCIYWEACYGGCPTMTINDDWRNRTYLCSMWKALFTFYGKVLSFCNINVVCANNGKLVCKAQVGQEPNHMGDHQDHLDYARIESNLPAANGLEQGWQHGDVEHGDWADHGDSYN